MSGFSSFQFGFQAGFQVIYGKNSIAVPAYNGNSVRQEYQPTSSELQYIDRLNKIEQLKAKERVTKQDLKANAFKLEQLELKRLRESLADEKLQQELMMLLLEKQQMELVQMELMRLIQEMMDENEAILIILLTSTF